MSTHQERVAIASIAYKSAKKAARYRARAEANALYLQRYAVYKAEAYALYSDALHKSALTLAEEPRKPVHTTTQNKVDPVLDLDNGWDYSSDDDKE